MEFKPIDSKKTEIELEDRDFMIYEMLRKILKLLELMERRGRI